jgi:asparagine synthase (glutamine-hydrolysing)
MCGIVGIIGLNAPVPAATLDRATKSLAHRGPDDGGTVILREPGERLEVGLGNRRLAILDLSPLGHQPMNDPATGNWIVYNGEVYNFREVRAKLERAGYQFSSHSDTEVILKAYAHWGAKCLGEFRGMFAFAIWNVQRKQLFLARDPMGIKPLYYYRSDRYFLFSSEVRTLLGTGLVPQKIDPAGLLNYLTFGSLYDPNTLIEGVHALAPGHWMTLTNGEVAEVQYWNLIGADHAECASAAIEDGAAREKMVNQIAEMLDECVRMQLVSDVPVGVFLSGGIDSSSLVGILSRAGLRPSTFSIIFREEDYSEAEYSRAVAQHFHTDHHEITVSQNDLFAAINPAIGAMDLPTIDGINTYFVSEKTRAAGVKVALSGLGGDELFAGYASFRTVPRLERLAKWLEMVPGDVRQLSAEAVEDFTSSTDQNRKLACLVHNPDIHPYFLSRMLFTPDQSKDLADPLLSHLVSTSQIGNLKFSLVENPDGVGKSCMSNLARQASKLDSINRISFLEARCYMLNTLLRDSDFMSMAHGLEVRVPLIDHQLARRVLDLPGRWKLNSKTPKPLLVKALDGQLPDKIVHRRKHGFTLPFEHWLRGALRPVLEESISRIGDGALAGFIGQPAAMRVWQNFLEGKASWSRPWSLYVLQQWCERHLSN